MSLSAAIAARLDVAAKWLRRPGRRERERLQALAGLCHQFPAHAVVILATMVDGDDYATAIARVLVAESAALRCEIVAASAASLAAIASVDRTAHARHTFLVDQLGAFR